MRSLKEIAFAFVALSLLMTILQTERLFYYIQTNLLFKVFILVSIPVIGLWLFISTRDYLHRRGIIFYCVHKFRSLPIPRAAKYLIVIILFGNLMAISLGQPRYPFYDVGMFRWSTPFRNHDKVMSQHKYYYWKNGQYKILDLRKEGSFFLAEHFGWGYTDEFMFGARFRHRGKQKNFEFLSALMKEQGVDTLWVGVHSVNFETREVTFDPDLCNAVKTNQTADLYYGPIYIPDYQLSRCHED
jgi:hypothetical protein